MSNSRIRAAIYVELTLVIPVLLLITFLSLEVSNALRIKQSITTLSRDIANAALRRCGEMDSVTDLRNCLQNRSVEFKAYADTLLRLRDQNLSQDLKLILSAYKYGNNCTNPLFTCPKLSASYPTNRQVSFPGVTKVSAFSHNDFFIPGRPYYDLLDKSRVLVTVEVYLAYEPLVVSGFSFLFKDTSNGKKILYETAIF